MADRLSVKPGIWQSARGVNPWLALVFAGCALGWIVLVLAVLDYFS